MKNMFRVLLASLLLVGATNALQADKFFKVCKRNDPNLNKCIENTLVEMRPALKKGIPQLKIPSIEPMFIPKIGILQGSGPVSIDSTFYNLTISGVSNYQIKSINANLDENKIDFKVRLPWMYNVGDYDMSGKILILPISGKGDSWTNYTGVSLSANLQGKPEDRNGKTFFKVQEIKFDTDVEKADIHLNNLFNGNKALGDTMNEFMREHWREVFQELKPIVDKAIGAIIEDIARKVFDQFPMDELFPK